MRDFLDVCLRRAGHDVQTAASGAEAIRRLAPGAFDLVLTDLTMPGVGGMEVLRHAVALDPAPIVLIMTAYATADTAIEAMKLGAYDYLFKPFKVDEIQVVIARAVERLDLRSENQRLREELRGVHSLDRMVGRSPAMQRVFELVRKVAPTRANVLIRGESGTGKELVARALHNLSERASAPFVAVNCGAIPGDLMESELFGHVRGAFTGANRDHEGMFVAAGEGTLFLDEIGDLGLATQVKLLRALQERSVRPVGGAKERPIQCRVVAATHRDLEAAVAAAEFRQDLYFRLNVVQVPLPPLRQRMEDVPLLLERVFARCTREMGRDLAGIGPSALSWFLAYDYPGNVRELENLVERAVALESGPLLTDEHLPPLPGRARAPIGGGSDATSFPPEGLDLDARLAEVERELLDQALRATGGVRKAAAKLLKISFRSLRYRLEKLGIEPPGRSDEGDEDSSHS